MKKPLGTEQELIEEISALKQRIKELEQSELKRKQADEILREAHERIATLLDGARDAIFIVDAESGLMLNVNSQACLLMNSTRESLIGSHHTRLHPQDMAGFYRRQLLERVKIPHPNLVEAEILTSDGRMVPVEISARGVTLSNGRRAMMAIFRDITERKLLEQELLKIQKIEAASLSAADLSYRFLTFSKGGTPIRQLSSIESIINRALSLSLGSSNVTCKCSFAPDLSLVEIDEGQMTQVFNNIFLNAKEAMPGGGILTISAGNAIIAVGDPVPVQPGNYVKISLQDNGIGISRENLSRIFDPYFSVKGLGSNPGRGLGLSICHSIIKQHEGHISAESESGESFIGQEALHYGKDWRGNSGRTEPVDCCVP